MKTSDIFNGFSEAPINFDPTFKYDVLQTLKGHRSVKKALKDAGRHLKQSKRAAGLLMGDNLEDDYSEDSSSSDDEAQDTKSLSSSVWTGAQSKHTADVPTVDDEDEAVRELDDLLRPAVENARMNAGSIPFGSPGFHHRAAHRAKEKLLGLLHRNSSAPMVPRRLSPVPSDDSPTGQQALPHPRRPIAPGMRSAQTSLDVPRPGEEEVEKPPFLRRAFSVKSEVVAEPEETEGVAKGERGVYDSSSKQRVPSW